MKRHRTALVLSAGGMFGAYQVGVWRALSRVFRPDVVVGASAGALNAWAIAAGAEAGDMAAAWMEESPVLRRRPRLRPRLQWFDNDGLEGLSQALCTMYQPRPGVEVGVVAVKVPRMSPVLFRSPEIDWRHLAASAAVPVVLPPVRIGDGWYVDGGLLGALPVWAAAAMGATRAVVINVLGDSPVVPGALLLKALRRVAGRKTRTPRDMEIIDFSPRGVLGGLDDAMNFRREKVARWLELGEREAEQRLEAMRGNISWPACFEAK